MTNLAPRKRGDIRDDGYIFSHHSSKQGEVWRSPASTHTQATARTLNKARERATAEGTPFDLDLEYIRSIYPACGLCPILGIPMIWGQQTGRDNSPSLDRRDPDKGYVKGNVAWISFRANRIKSDASLSELKSIVSYMAA
jgi:hypothetical protein